MKPEQKVNLSVDDWKAEIDAMRPTGHPNAITLTDEQKEILVHARDEAKLGWKGIVAWWKKTFGWGNKTTLRRRYKEIKEKELGQ